MGGIARWLQFFFREPEAEALTVIGLQPKIAVPENFSQRLRINADFPAAAQMAAFGDKAIEFIGCVADFCLPAYQNSITSEVAKIAHDQFFPSNGLGCERASDSSAVASSAWSTRKT